MKVVEIEDMTRMEGKGMEIPEIRRGLEVLGAGVPEVLEVDIRKDKSKAA
jgi:hypothetical protein